MIINIFIGLVAISTIVAFSNWRRGLFMLLIVGMFQDPVRKLTPGAPPIFVLSTLPVWCAIAVNMFTTEQKLISLFFRHYMMLVSNMKMFAIILIPAGFIMLNQGQQLWKVLLLGALTFLSPIFSIILGYVIS